jgi:6-phosphogluconate dehydrogenase
MQLGMVGLGRMGANMVRRLLTYGHECVVFDMSPKAVDELVDQTIADLAPALEAGDTIIDGGNSYYVDDIRRAHELMSQGVNYVDVGTSGGVWGLERGYCMMIGGPDHEVQRLDPIFKTLAPGEGSISRTPGRKGDPTTAELGYLHCGTNGAGHFVKMVHNGIEYGIMAAYAEGLDILRAANVGKKTHAIDAETTPLRNPDHYKYDINLPDVAEVWRRGSVIASWLLDLTATALTEDSALSKFSGHVSDSGEGRWTIKAAIDEGVPVPVLSTALYERFFSRGEADYQNKLLSAMRFQFGGHLEKPNGK